MEAVWLFVLSLGEVDRCVVEIVNIGRNSGE